MVRASDIIILIAVVAGLLAAWDVGLSVSLGVLNGQNVKTLNFVPPVGGDVALVAGAGIAVVPDVASNSIELENTGVITVNSLSPAAGGNIVLAATAPGLTVTSVGHTITFANGGVTALGAGFGIAVSNTTGPITVSNTGVLTINEVEPTGGDIALVGGAGITVTTLTIADDISVQTALPETDANSSSVTYALMMGTDIPITPGSWRIGPTPGFPVPFFPGAASDSGYGDQGGVAWAVPASSVGMFAVNVNCEVEPLNIAVDDLQTVSIALCLGATSEDPYAAGIIPSGAYATLPVAGGSTSGVAPPIPSQLSVATTFVAGCSGCAIQGADALTLHMRTDHTSGVKKRGVDPFSVTAMCFMTVTHLR